ncbi:MAG: hypothetical protein AAFR38_02020 [Planctomycetota bacterium]
MTRTISAPAGRCARAAAALAALAAGGAASANVFTFQAFNHPDGAVNNQQYGMRLDNFGPDSRVTFTMEDAQGLSTVTLTLNTDIGGGQASLTIEGTVRGNSASNGTALGEYLLSMSYVGTFDDQAMLFSSFSGDQASGTLTALSVTADSPLAQGQVLDLGPKSRSGGEQLYFGIGIPGGRLSGPDAATTWEAQGWLMSALSSGTQDFLFTAIPTVNPPAPGAAALVGLGGLVAARRRR